jgi:light-independent protochlorophyllide reductase subunit B
MGFEGANVLFDSWVHPLMMGLEEHLLTMFREDFEFAGHAAPSHIGSTATVAAPPPDPSGPIVWSAEAEKEVGKIPFFVRGKARRNTEKFAQERGLATVTVDTLYDAKAHYAR